LILTGRHGFPIISKIFTTKDYGDSLIAITSNKDENLFAQHTVMLSSKLNDGQDETYTGFP